MPRLTAGVERDSCFTTDNYLMLEKHIHSHFPLTMKG